MTGITKCDDYSKMGRNASEELKKIICSFDNDKSNDPNSIPTKFRKILNDKIAEHRVEVFEKKSFYF